MHQRRPVAFGFDLKVIGGGWGKLRQAGVMKILPVGGGISALLWGSIDSVNLGPEDERTPYLTRCPLPFLPVVQETVARVEGCLVQITRHWEGAAVRVGANCLVRSSR